MCGSLHMLCYRHVWSSVIHNFFASYSGDVIPACHANNWQGWMWVNPNSEYDHIEQASTTHFWGGKEANTLVFLLKFLCTILNILLILFCNVSRPWNGSICLTWLLIKLQKCRSTCNCSHCRLDSPCNCRHMSPNLYSITQVFLSY